MVEGIDHTGKTTLAAAMVHHLRAKGLLVGEHVEPGHGSIGAFLRATSRAGQTVSARALALLSTAAREAEQPDLHRLLATCQVVISDRYYLSGLAYHAADGIPSLEYQSWNQEIIRPDLYVVLHADATVRAQRAGETPDGYWESPQIAERLPAAYAACVDLIRASENARVLALDAQPAPDVVLEKALRALAPLLEGTLS